MKKVNAYIDGFNVYHGIKKYIDKNNLPKSFSWVNPRAIVSHFIDKKHEFLHEVYFFSAIPNHKEPEKRKRI